MNNSINDVLEIFKKINSGVPGEFKPFAVFALLCFLIFNIFLLLKNKVLCNRIEKIITDRNFQVAISIALIATGVYYIFIFKESTTQGSVQVPQGDSVQTPPVPHPTMPPPSPPPSPVPPTPPPSPMAVPTLEKSEAKRFILDFFELKKGKGNLSKILASYSGDLIYYESSKPDKGIVEGYLKNFYEHNPSPSFKIDNIKSEEGRNHTEKIVRVTGRISLRYNFFTEFVIRKTNEGLFIISETGEVPPMSP